MISSLHDGEFYGLVFPNKDRLCWVVDTSTIPRIGGVVNLNIELQRHWKLEHCYWCIFQVILEHQQCEWIYTTILDMKGIQGSCLINNISFGY